MAVAKSETPQSIASVAKSLDFGNVDVGTRKDSDSSDDDDDDDEEEVDDFEALKRSLDISQPSTPSFLSASLHVSGYSKLDDSQPAPPPAREEASPESPPPRTQRWPSQQPVPRRQHSMSYVETHRHRSTGPGAYQDMPIGSPFAVGHQREYVRMVQSMRRSRPSRRHSARPYWMLEDDASASQFSPFASSLMGDEGSHVWVHSRVASGSEWRWTLSPSPSSPHMRALALARALSDAEAMGLASQGLSWEYARSLTPESPHSTRLPPQPRTDEPRSVKHAAGSPSSMRETIDPESRSSSSRASFPNLTVTRSPSGSWIGGFSS
jgi:hypothetical protein